MKTSVAEKKGAGRSVDPLFEPFVINGLRLPNRIVMPSMGHGKAPGGVLGPEFAEFFRLRAEGGNGVMPIWEVDGRPIGQGREVRWALLPGRHRIVARAPGVGERSVMIQVESAPR